MKAHVLREAKRSLKRLEGFRSKPYKDTTGHLTVGYGTNLDAGITEDEGEALLLVRAGAEYDWLTRKYAWFSKLDHRRQRAMVEMTYQLGRGGLQQWPKFLRAMREGRYEAAAYQLTVNADGTGPSRFVLQTPRRVEHLTALLVG